MTNADNILFRPSSAGKLMTEPKEKAAKERGDLGETTKKYLLEVYINHVYGRKKDIKNKYIEKGLKSEEDAITLYSRAKKVFFKKNTERIANDYLTGEPDLFVGEKIRSATSIIDTKCSYDIFTFFNAKHEKINTDYYWQGQSYMDLTGATTFRLAYCLVNNPQSMIEDEKRKLAWSMGLIDPSVSEEYQKACEEIDRLSIYDDIDMKDRIHEIIIQRNDADIEKLHAKILKCRAWMNDNLFKTPVLLASLDKEVNATMVTEG